MSSLNKTILAKLNQMYETLDDIQELQQIQDNQELMNELGESMGHIDNAINIIIIKEEQLRFKQQHASVN